MLFATQENNYFLIMRRFDNEFNHTSQVDEK